MRCHFGCALGTIFSHFFRHRQKMECLLKTLKNEANKFCFFKSRQHRESNKQMWQTTSVENNVWMFCIISQIMQHIHYSLDVKKELRPKFKTSGTSNSHYPDISICIEWDTQCLNIPQNVSLISTLIYIYISGPLILSSCLSLMHDQTSNPRRLKLGM